MSETSRITWRVAYGGIAEDVCGFLEAKLARRHAEKHFLAQGEKWADLVREEASRPSAFSQRLAAAPEGAARAAVLDEASVVYVGAVKSHTTGHGIRRALLGRYWTPGGHAIPALGVATQTGIYACFDRAKGRGPSHLTTAFRPRPERIHRSPRPIDHAEAAVRHLNRKLR